MRLREVQKIIRENIDELEFVYDQIQNLNPPQYEIKNILLINKAIHSFERIGLFGSEITLLKGSSLYNNPNNEIRVNQTEFVLIRGELIKISQNSNIMLEAFKGTLGSDNLDSGKTVSVKIEEVKNLDELILICEKLRKVIQLPLSEYENGGELKIENFDSGSFWIDFLLPTASSVSLVGSIAWAGAVIYKKYTEAYAFRQYADGLKVQKEHLEILKEAAKKKIDLDIEAEAKLIQNEFFKSDDLEQLGRLKLSIKEYSELIQKGVQIQPALAAPEEINNLFPNYKLIELVESKIKHLPEAS